MAYLNISIDSSMDVAEAHVSARLTADCEFWRKRAERLQQILENIPAAVEQYGSVTISQRGRTITLVAEPASDAEEPSP